MQRRILALLAGMFLLLWSECYGQAPPEELSYLRQVLGVPKETKLLGPNALQSGAIPNQRPIRVCLAVGFDTTVHSNIIRALNQANERSFDSYLKEARKQKEEQLKRQVADKRERQRLLNQWQASYRPPHFQVVSKIEEADVALARYTLMHAATQKIESKPEKATVWKSPLELPEKERQEHPLGRSESTVIQKTQSRTVVPAFGYILRVQDGGQSLLLAHRYQSEDPLESDSNTGTKLVDDLIRLVNTEQ